MSISDATTASLLDDAATLSTILGGANPPTGADREALERDLATIDAELEARSR